MVQKRLSQECFRHFKTPEKKRWSTATWYAENVYPSLLAVKIL